MGVWEPANSWWLHVADLKIARDDLLSGYGMLYRSDHARAALRRTVLTVAALTFAFSIFLTFGWAAWLSQGRVGERAWPWLYWLWFGSPVMVITLLIAIPAGGAYTLTLMRRQIAAALRLLGEGVNEHRLTLCWNDSHMLAQVDEREFSFDLVDTLTWDETNEMLVIKPPLGLLALRRDGLSNAQAAHLRERMVILAVPRGRLPKRVMWTPASI